MKRKILLANLIFLLLVVFSLSSFAIDDITDLSVDLSYFAISGLTDLNIYDYFHTYISNTDLANYDNCFSIYQPDNSYIYIFISTEPYYIRSQESTYYTIASSVRNYYIQLDSTNLSLIDYDFANGGSNIANVPTVINLDSNSMFISNILYTDSTCTTEYTGSDLRNINYDDVSFYNNAFNYDSSGGGSSGDSGDYTYLLTHIDNDLHGIDSTISDMQNTVNDTYNSVDNIDNNVSGILGILQNQNQNQVINAIGITSAQTQNMINQQTTQQQENFNTLTNTTYYDTSDAVIDSSGFSTQDVNGVDNFLIAFYNTYYDFFDTLHTQGNIQVSFPVPFTNNVITLNSQDITDFYADHPSLSHIITVLWYVTLGRFIIGLSISMFNWFANGKILKDTDQVLKEINNSNFIVKDLMM